MDKFLSLCVLSGLLWALGATGLARAANDKEKSDDKSFTTRGRIADVRLSDKQIVVKTRGGKELKLVIDAHSKLRFNHRDAKPEQFKKDMRVKVTYETDGEKNRLLVLKANVIRPDELARRIGGLLEKAGAIAADQMPELLNNADEILTFLEEALDNLADKAAEANPEMRKEITKDADAIREQLKAARKRLEKLKTAGPAAAEDLKKGLKESLEGLQKAIEKARSRLDD